MLYRLLIKHAFLIICIIILRFLKHTHILNHSQYYEINQIYVIFTAVCFGLNE